MKAIRWGICLAAAALAAVAFTQTIEAPIDMKGLVASAASTKLDLGDAKSPFDGDPATLARTDSVNPATFSAEFVRPVTFEHVRLRVIDVKHQWSLAVADSLADLRAKSGSYRLLVSKRVSTGDTIDARVGRTTAKAVELTLKRLEGDDYVHLFEAEFCQPAKVTGLTIRRVLDRRDPTGPKGWVEVGGSLPAPVQTVVALHARAEAGKTVLPADKELTWECGDKGIRRFGREPGSFLVVKPGKHTLTAKYGSYTRTIEVVGTPRKVANREPDLDVLFIEKTPRLNYDAPNGGWPKEGQLVKWVAHTMNWGEKPVRARYAWTLDGKVVAEGKVRLRPGTDLGNATKIALPWKWEQKRHALKFAIEAVDGTSERIAANNQLEIATNAVTIGLWVEQSLWEFMHEHQHRLPTQDGNSFGAWAQRLARQWNGMFDEAVYKAVPHGITERVRIDLIRQTPDFALPLAGGLPSNNPDLRDRTVDMTWGMESGDIGPGTIVAKDHWWSPERALEAFAKGEVQGRRTDPPFWCGLGFIHEMNHARYLVDSYGFNVHSDTGKDPSKWSIKVRDEKGPIMGRYIPLVGDLMHSQKFDGHMGGDYWKFSAFEAMCWNRVQGKRARGGNCNSPEVIGEFLQEVPKEVVLKFVDQDGQPMAGAEVVVYRAHGTGEGWYTKVYEDEPVLPRTADSDGQVRYDRTLWSADGKIRHDYGVSQAVALLRVTYKGQHYYLFENVADASLAYNLGQRDSATFWRRVRTRTGEPDPKEWNVKETWEVPGHSFSERPDGWVAPVPDRP